MTIERKEVGPRMSQIVIHGDTVYLGGIVAHANKGKSVTEQTKEILATIDSYLAQADSNKTKLLSASIWITDMAKFAEMNAVLGRLGGAGPDAGAPASRPGWLRSTITSRSWCGRRNDRLRLSLRKAGIAASFNLGRISQWFSISRRC